MISEVVLESGETVNLNIDDFSLIKWQAAYSKQLAPNHFNNQSVQTSYLGIDRDINQPVTLKF